MHACCLSSEFMHCSAGNGHTAVAVDPGVLDTALARDYFRSEVCCSAEAKPCWVSFRWCQCEDMLLPCSTSQYASSPCCKPHDCRFHTRCDDCCGRWWRQSCPGSCCRRPLRQTQCCGRHPPRQLRCFPDFCSSCSYIMQYHWGFCPLSYHACSRRNACCLYTHLLLLRCLAACPAGGWSICEERKGAAGVSPCRGCRSGRAAVARQLPADRRGGLLLDTASGR